MIIGIIIAGFVVIGIIVTIIICKRKKKTKIVIEKDLQSIKTEDLDVSLNTQSDILSKEKNMRKFVLENSI